MAGISVNVGAVGLRGYTASSDQLQTAMERLSTGKRINRGADDPSGLIGATHMRSDQVALQKDIEGLTRQSHELATREGALSAVDGDVREQAAIGTQMRENEAVVRTKQAELEAVSGGLSRIEDADMARESSEAVRDQVLQKASLAAAVIGQQNAGSVLDLLDATLKGPAVK